MEMSVLFESFMVGYLLAVMVYTAIAVWYLQQDQQEQQQQKDIRAPSGPTAAQVMAMHKMRKELERQQK
jgi:NADH:ubiquinone oxidoreductase subunit 6 (subunit J)